MHTRILSIYSHSFFKGDLYKDLDFYVCICAYEKRVSEKQP